MSDTYASLLAIALATWTFLAFSVDRRLFYAVLLHNTAWVAALAVVGSGVMNYDPLSVFAWTVITAAIAAFNAGVALTRGRPGIGNVARTGTRPLTSLGVYAVLLLGFTAGFALYLWTIQSNYGLVTLLSDPTSIREYSEGPGYLELFPLYGKVLFYLGPLCFALTILPDLVRGLRQRSVVLRYGIALYLVLAQAAVLQRTNVFVAVVMVVGILLLRAGSRAPGSHRVPAGRRLVGLVVLAVMSVLVFQGIAVALGKTGSDDPTLANTVDPAIADSSAVTVMHYLASGVPAFSKLVESHDGRWPDPNDVGNAYGDFNPQTWGRATLAAPLKLVPGVQVWQEIAPFTTVPSKTNVYTWLEPWYRDFRAPGAVLGALAVGMLAGTAARWAGRSSRALVLGGLVIGFSGLGTFVNRYGAVMSIVLYAVVWWIGRPRPEPLPSRPWPAAEEPGTAGPGAGEPVGPRQTNEEGLARRGRQ